MAREELQGVESKDDASEDDVRSAWRKVSTLEEELVVGRLRTAQQVRQVLTPEQRKKFAENRAKMRQARGGGPVGVRRPGQMRGATESVPTQSEESVPGRF